jgi:hypothetical protein
MVSPKAFTNGAGKGFLGSRWHLDNNVRISVISASSFPQSVILLVGKIERSSSVFGPPARRRNSTIASSLLQKAKRGSWLRRRSQSKKQMCQPLRKVRRLGHQDFVHGSGQVPVLGNWVLRVTCCRGVRVTKHVPMLQRRMPSSNGPATGSRGPLPRRFRLPQQRWPSRSGRCQRVPQERVSVEEEIDAVGPWHTHQRDRAYETNATEARLPGQKRRAEYPRANLGRQGAVKNEER